MAEGEKISVGPGWSAMWVNVVLVGAVLAFVIVEGRGGIALDADASVSDQTRDLLWFAMLCGLAGFATIEILKRVFGLRGLYQSRQTAIWLQERAGGGRRAYKELVHAMGALGSETKTGRTAAVRRVFNLPTEQLAAQVAVAAELAQARPGSYEYLIAGLAGGPAEPDEKEDLRVQRVRAGIDQLQISLGERWRRYVQGAALWLAGAYAIVLVHASEADDGAEARYVLVGLVIGGLIAWVVRDITAVIERARR